MAEEHECAPRAQGERTNEEERNVSALASQTWEHVFLPRLPRVAEFGEVLRRRICFAQQW